MPRYIDADAFFADFAEIRDYEYASQEYEVDAVEVVRCKDCKHNQGSCCDYSAVYVRPHGYCQWGERREDGHD